MHEETYMYEKKTCRNKKVHVHVKKTVAEFYLYTKYKEMTYPWCE